MKRKLIVLAMFILLMLDAIPSAMAACSHKWMTESYTAPTCTSDGKSVQRCMVCGASKTSTSSKLGHNKKTNTTNASCSEAGKKVTYCTRSGCNYTKVETIPKEAHSFGKWTTKKPPTCSSTGIEKRICSVCSYEENRPITYKDPGNHSNLDKVVPTKPSTCTETGSGYRLCKACKEKVTVTIPKKAHDYGNWTTKKAPTCSSTGIEKRVCSVCNYEENRPITYKDPGNHSNLGDVEPTKDSTCTEIGSGYRVCTACKEKVTVKIPRKPHEYSNWTTKKAPTCSSTGIEKRVCSVCGDEENRPITYKDPGNHSNLGDLEIDYDSTCTEEGKGYRVCRACGEKVIETIPTKPHEYGDWTTIIPPTCSSIGIKGRLCTECGEEAPDRQPITYLDPANHSSLGEWETTKEPSCVEGEEKATCCVCGVTVTRSLEPIRKHNYGKWMLDSFSMSLKKPIAVRICACGEREYGDAENAKRIDEDYSEVRQSVEFNGVQYLIPSVNDGMVHYVITYDNGTVEHISERPYTWNTNGTEDASGEIGDKVKFDPIKGFVNMSLENQPAIASECGNYDDPTPYRVYETQNVGTGCTTLLIAAQKFIQDSTVNPNYMKISLKTNGDGTKSASISVNNVAISRILDAEDGLGGSFISTPSKFRIKEGGYIDDAVGYVRTDKDGNYVLVPAYDDTVTHKDHPWLPSSEVTISGQKLPDEYIEMLDALMEKMNAPAPTPSPKPTPTNAPKPPQATPVPTPSPNSGTSRSLSSNEEPSLSPESEPTPELTPIPELTPEPTPIPEPATPTDLMPL